MARAFFDPVELPWTSEFPAKHESLCSEISSVCASGAMPSLYPQHTEPLSSGARKIRWFGLSAIFFTIQNKKLLTRLPALAALVERVPQLLTAGIVKLEGDTHIKPHAGYTPDALRCHYGLRVPEPESCMLRVGDEKRHWHEGQWLIFDDYQEHEVWHRGVASRIIILVDVVRPGVELTPRQVAERFFGRAAGTRFDADLEALGRPKQWLTWLDAG